MYCCFQGGPADQILDLFGPVLDAGGKPGCPSEKNLSKQVRPGNLMHIKAGTGNGTWDSLVQSEGRYALLTCRYHIISSMPQNFCTLCALSRPLSCLYRGICYFWDYSHDSMKDNDVKIIM